MRDDGVADWEEDEEDEELKGDGSSHAEQNMEVKDGSQFMGVSP